MRGTIHCEITDGEEGHAALAVAAELSQRLGLRLVLVHIADASRRATSTARTVRALRPAPAAREPRA